MHDDYLKKKYSKTKNISLITPLKKLFYLSLISTEFNSFDIIDSWVGTKILETKISNEILHGDSFPQRTSNT